MIEMATSITLKTSGFGSRCKVLALALVMMGVWSLIASAQSTNGPVRQDYSAFKIITERNIFNPRRSTRSSRVREARPTAKVEFFTLVGTMSYEKGTFAFFDGSKSEYRKVVKSADAIAGYTVSAIAPNSVKLTSATNTIQLGVGKQMRRDDESDWQLGTAPEASAGSRVASASSRRSFEPRVAPSEPQAETTNPEPQVIVVDTASQTVVTEGPPDGASSNAGSESGSNGSDDPVLRRLMQRREQEINR
jgi:hypothetical protein